MLAVPSLPALDVALAAAEATAHRVAASRVPAQAGRASRPRHARYGGAAVGLRAPSSFCWRRAASNHLAAALQRPGMLEPSSLQVSGCGNSPCPPLVDQRVLHTLPQGSGQLKNETGCRACVVSCLVLSPRTQAPPHRTRQLTTHPHDTSIQLPCVCQVTRGNAAQ